MSKRQQSRSEINEKYKWDLSKLIKDEEDLNLTYNKILELTNQLESYKGKILKSDKTLYEYLKLDEKLDYEFARIYEYSHTLCDSDSTVSSNQALKLKIEQLGETINEKLSFSRNELIDAGYENIKKYIDSNENLKLYSYYFENFFRYESHTLSKVEEELITQFSNVLGTGEDVFYNIENTDVYFGEVTNEVKEKIELTNANYKKLLTSKKASVRKSVFKKYYKYYQSHINSLASTLRSNVKENILISKIRKYHNPISMSLYSDAINENFYDKLINEVHEFLPYLHKYINVKKQLMKVNKIHMYDMYYIPVENKIKNITYEEGQNILFEALYPLGEDYLAALKLAFEGRWIDVYPNIGKSSGAYCTGYATASNPFILLNYTNTMESVSTMAHELGHAIHSYYSNKNNEYVYHQYKIFLAEIASTVNELLLNSYLLNEAKTKEEKIYYIIDFLEKVRTTIYRQTQFAEFEKIIHQKAINEIPLTSEEICNTYYDLNKKYYGNTMVNDEEIKYEWSVVPHFYNSFYVFKYATGLSCAIVIADKLLRKEKGFKDKYLEFLSSGGKDYPLNILKKLDIDIENDNTIKNALKLFESKLEELINLAK